MSNAERGGTGGRGGTSAFRPVLNAVLLVLVGVFLARLPRTIEAITGDYAFAAPVDEVRRALVSRWVNVPDEAALQRGAIEGMLRSLDDPYAMFIPMTDRERFDKQVTGTFVGIGVQVEPSAPWLTVMTPLEGSPALRAGIQAGDIIAEIDGVSTQGLSLDECVQRLTGRPGTPVTLLVRRGASADGERPEQELTITVIRDRITAGSVRGIRRRDGGNGAWDYFIDAPRRIAYFRLSQFTPTSAAELRAAIEEAEAAGPGLEGLILDLRDDPGGLMDAAIAIVDLFVRDGVIMSTRGRDGKDHEKFNARAEGTLPETPMAVLVNGRSASAAEIVAGALQDHGRALVVGERTFGKGTVQTVLSLWTLGRGGDRAAQVRFTTQRYYLPSGRAIQREDGSAVWGVDPDDGFYVPMSDQERLAAYRARREADVIRPPGNGAPSGVDAARWADPTWIAREMHDPQLAGALTALQTRLLAGPGGAGGWTPVSPASVQHGRIASDELKRLEDREAALLEEVERTRRRGEALRALAIPRSEEGAAAPAESPPPKP